MIILSSELDDKITDSVKNIVVVNMALTIVLFISCYVLAYLNFLCFMYL
jgi:hypothetical protein